MAHGRVALLLAALACATWSACTAADGDADTAQAVQCENADGDCIPDTSEEGLRLLQHKARALSNSSTTGVAWKKIYLIRHAERWGGDSCLNECGWNRARQYGEKLKRWPIYKIYAFNYQYYTTVKNSCERTAQTASWIAAYKKEKIDYIVCGSPPKNMRDVEGYQDDLMAKRLIWHIKEDPGMKAGDIILVFWEHDNILRLIDHLCGAKGVDGARDPKCMHVPWPKDPSTGEASYDVYFEIDYLNMGGQWHHKSPSQGFWGIGSVAKGWKPEDCYQCSETKVAPKYKNAPPTSERSSRRRYGCPYGEMDNSHGYADAMDTTANLGVCP